MASLEIFDPRCEFEGCLARATRALTQDGVVKGRYCSKHGQTALVETNKTERAAARSKPQTVKA